MFLAIEDKIKKHKIQFEYFSPTEDIKLRYAIFSPNTKTKKSPETILLLPGKSEFIEKYSEIILHWLKKNYQVIMLEHRGQGLSTRPLPDTHKCHIDSFETYADDFLRFFDHLKLNRKNPLIFAHSMGALVLLTALLKTKLKIKGIILSAPLIHINFPERSVPALKRVLKLIKFLGLEHLYAPSQGPYKTYSFKKNPLTSDPLHFQLQNYYYQKDPALKIGGATFGWIRASFEAGDRLLSSPHKIPYPTLILASSRDSVISYPAIKASLTQFKEVEFHNISQAKHELFMEKPEILDQLWKKIDIWRQKL